MESVSSFRLGDLSPSPDNPRVINDEEKLLLTNSLADLGDMGGIVYNRITKHIISGHQRIRAILEAGQNPEIVITESFDLPQSQGTVALGYFTYCGEKFSYREVEWFKGEERIALIAANRMGGHFDHDRLGRMFNEFLRDNGRDFKLLQKTGFSEAFLFNYAEGMELRQLMISDFLKNSPRKNPLEALAEIPEDLPVDDIEDQISDEEDEIANIQASLQTTCPKCGHVFVHG